MACGSAAQSKYFVKVVKKKPVSGNFSGVGLRRIRELGCHEYSKEGPI